MFYFVLPLAAASVNRVCLVRPGAEFPVFPESFVFLFSLVSQLIGTRDVLCYVLMKRFVPNFQYSYGWKILSIPSSTPGSNRWKTEQIHQDWRVAQK